MANYQKEQYNEWRGRDLAIVATARHMAESVYWVLTNKEYLKGGMEDKGR